VETAKDTRSTFSHDKDHTIRPHLCVACRGREVELRSLAIAKGPPRPVTSSPEPTTLRGKTNSYTALPKLRPINLSGCTEGEKGRIELVLNARPLILHNSPINNSKFTPSSVRQ